MYLPFMMCGYAGTLLMVLAGLRIVDRSIPGLRGMRTLTTAVVCGFATVVLIAVRPWAPAFFSIIASDSAYLAAQLLIYQAVAQVLQRPPRWLKPGILLASAGLAALCWFTYASPSLLARILVESGIVMLINALTAGLLLRHRDPGLRYPVKGLAWLFTAVAATHLVRCVLSLIFPPLDFIHADVSQAAFTYVNMVITLATVIGTLWLAACIQRKELHRMAHTDALTGLMNRRAFEEALEQALARCERTRKGVALMMLDIDHFKRINDMGGHAAGDQALRNFAAGLRAVTRRTDLVARWGGEEFTILLYDVWDKDAPVIAEKIRAAIAELPAVEGNIRLTASIGLAISRPGESLSDLLRRCDEALYRSKRKGRNQVTIHGMRECPEELAAGPA